MGSREVDAATAATEARQLIPDVTTFAANLVVFLTAVGAAVAGSLAMVKKIKSSWETAFPAKDPQDGVITQHKMVGTMLMETTTAAMLTESQRALHEEMSEARNDHRELRFALVRLTDEVRELRHEMGRRRDV